MRALRWVGALALAPLLLVLPSSPAASVEDRCPSDEPTVVGTAGDDVLVGTSGDDVIHALSGDDTVRGRGGNDVLCGGPGTDRLVGGDGDDRMYGGANGLQQPWPDNPPDNVGDTLVPGPGDDHVDPGHDVETDADGGWLPDTVSFAGSPQGVQVDLAAGSATGEGQDPLVAEGVVAVVGSAHDDVLSGSDRADDLYGGQGADLLRGLGGDDSLHADPDVHRRDRPGWDDEVHGGPGSDHLDLGNGDDVGRGGAGRDSLVHLSGPADLRGGAGNDYLESYLEHVDGQQLLGGAGRDTLYAWSVLGPGGQQQRARGRIDLTRGVARIDLDGDVRRVALAGFEVLRVPDGTWRVLGTAAEEVFYGAETAWSRLLVRAGGGDDLIGGSPGDDRIDGGPGSDRSGNDQGRDVCISIERSWEPCEVNR